MVSIVIAVLISMFFLAVLAHVHKSEPKVFRVIEIRSLKRSNPSIGIEKLQLFGNLGPVFKVGVEEICNIGLGSDFNCVYGFLEILEEGVQLGLKVRLDRLE